MSDLQKVECIENVFNHVYSMAEFYIGKEGESLLIRRRLFKIRKTRIILQTIFISILIFSFELNAKNPMIFSNNNDAKIHKLIAQITIEEKAHQLCSYYYGQSKQSNADVRLGIPNLVAGECLHGVMADGATVFPRAIAMASIWDTNLIERMGNVVAKEIRACDIHQCYGPMVAIIRDVRWGCTEEGYGEYNLSIATDSSDKKLELN